LGGGGGVFFFILAQVGSTSVSTYFGEFENPPDYYCRVPQSINQQIKQSIKQPINQATNQSSNQPIKQQTNQPTQKFIVIIDIINIIMSVSCYKQQHGLAA